MITFDFVAFIMKIARFGEDLYWFLCLFFWSFYFLTFHTLLHEIRHVKMALRFGCTDHKVILYDRYQDSSFIFWDIPVESTTKTDGLKLGTACYTPRAGLSEYEKYCITRAGFRFDLAVLTIFFISSEIAIYPAYYEGKSLAFWLLTATLALLTYGYLGIQYFIKGTDLYKMCSYKNNEYVTYRKSVALQRLSNWRSKRAQKEALNENIVEFNPLKLIVSNASGFSND